MVKSLAKCAVVLAMVAGFSGCAAGEIGSDEEADAIRSAESTLSMSTLPKGVVMLHSEALQLADGRVIVDLAITNIPRPPTDADEPALHDSGEFVAVMVYRVNDGSKTPIATITRKEINAIGPGGGCIHFFVPARLGDQLFIGGAVKPTGQGATIGAAPITTVQTQIEGSPYEQWPFAGLTDHALPAP